MNKLILLVLCSAMLNASAAILLSDTFPYPDGVLTNVSSGKWRHTSGGADQVNVSAGAAELTRAETEDVSASLATAFAASSPAVLYVKFKATVTALPLGANGNYFAHLDGGSARARIFVTTNAAVFPGLPDVAPGKFRFGIGNASTAPTGVWLSDLDVGETYTVVARLRVSTGLADLFVNPMSENDLTVPAGDGASAASVNAFALRQDSGMGTLLVDDIVVATSFGEALTGNETPGISNMADQQGVQDVASVIPFTIGDAESAADTLAVFASVSDTNLVQGLAFTGSGSNRSLTITPRAGLTGAVEVTVFVTDGTTTNHDSFVLTFVPALIFSESFDYADGALATNAAAPWVHHSGAVTGQLQVVNGRAQLTTAQTEDISVALPGGPYATNSGVKLFVSFQLNLLQLPGSTGDYFAHFNTTGARCRLFASTANAGAGRFRLGIANGSNTASEQLAVDLETNVNYFVVLRYDPSTAVSTLWVNPAVESDAGTSATDVAAPSAMNAFALRQDTGIGTFTLDDLRIGLSFASVAGSPPSPLPALRIERLGNGLRLAWPHAAAGFVLQASTNLNSPEWIDVADTPNSEGDDNVVTNTPEANVFFRLKKSAP